MPGSCPSVSVTVPVECCGSLTQNDNCCLSPALLFIILNKRVGETVESPCVASALHLSIIEVRVCWQVSHFRPLQGFLEEVDCFIMLAGVTNEACSGSSCLHQSLHVADRCRISGLFRLILPRSIVSFCWQVSHFRPLLAHIA